MVLDHRFFSIEREEINKGQPGLQLLNAVNAFAHTTPGKRLREEMA